MMLLSLLTLLFSQSLSSNIILFGEFHLQNKETAEPLNRFRSNMRDLARKGKIQLFEEGNTFYLDPESQIYQLERDYIHFLYNLVSSFKAFHGESVHQQSESIKTARLNDFRRLFASRGIRIKQQVLQLEGPRVWQTMMKLWWMHFFEEKEWEMQGKLQAFGCIKNPSSQSCQDLLETLSTMRSKFQAEEFLKKRDRNQKSVIIVGHNHVETFFEAYEQLRHTSESDKISVVMHKPSHYFWSQVIWGRPGLSLTPIVAIIAIVSAAASQNDIYNWQIPHIKVFSEHQAICLAYELFQISEIPMNDTGFECCVRRK